MKFPGSYMLQDSRNAVWSPKGPPR